MKPRVPLFLFACALSLAPACGGAVSAPTSPTAAACDLTLAPASQVVTRDGGSFHTRVAGACAWNATADQNWIAVTYGEGFSLGTVTYTVAANDGDGAREGRVRIGEEVLHVVQEGRPVEPVAPLPTPAPARAGRPTGPPRHRAPAPPRPHRRLHRRLRRPPPPPPRPAAACAATTTAATATSTATSAATAVQVRGGSIQPVGAGKRRRILDHDHHRDRLQMVGVVVRVVDRRQIRERRRERPRHLRRQFERWIGANGKIDVGGTTVSISQEAMPRPEPTCTVSLSPSSQSVPLEGGVFTIKVGVDARCSWSAEGGASWIAFKSRSGTGSGEIVYVVERHSGPARSAAITVSGQGVKVSQAGVK